ncbi:C-type lectin domain-containing protein, partial [Meloidogyne graminicola]
IYLIFILTFYFVFNNAVHIIYVNDGYNYDEVEAPLLPNYFKGPYYKLNKKYPSYPKENSYKKTNYDNKNGYKKKENYDTNYKSKDYGVVDVNYVPPIYNKDDNKEYKKPKYNYEVDYNKQNNNYNTNNYKNPTYSNYEDNTQYPTYENNNQYKTPEYNDQYNKQYKETNNYNKPEYKEDYNNKQSNYNYEKNNYKDKKSSEEYNNKGKSSYSKSSSGSSSSEDHSYNNKKYKHHSYESNEYENNYFNKRYNVPVYYKFLPNYRQPNIYYLRPVYYITTTTPAVTEETTILTTEETTESITTEISTDSPTTEISSTESETTTSISSTIDSTTQSESTTTLSSTIDSTTEISTTNSERTSTETIPTETSTTPTNETTTLTTSIGTEETITTPGGTEETTANSQRIFTETTPTVTEIPGTTPDSECPPDYEYNQPNNYCIKLSSPNQTNLTWNEANNEAKKNGAKLASIHNEKEDEFIKDLVNKQSGEDKNIYWIGLQMNATNGKIQKAEWSDKSNLNYGNPGNLKPNAGPYGTRTAINGNTAYAGISKNQDGKSSWGLYDKNQKGGYVWQIDLSGRKDNNNGDKDTTSNPGINTNGLPSGYTCTNECDPKSIELTQQNGQSAPIDEGFKEENNCRTTVLTCNSKEPIASIAFGSKGTVQANDGGKTKVRAKIYCAREETTQKVGWLRNVANNNPRLFFFVEEAHCEQQKS